MLPAQVEHREAKENSARANQKRDPGTNVLFEQSRSDNGFTHLSVSAPTVFQHNREILTNSRR
jgi:hypothetical protein